jgi:hypothetical protein
MIVDKGGDFPQEIDAALRKYGESMWYFREQPCRTTARALNSSIGDHKKWVSKVAASQPPLYARPPCRTFVSPVFLFSQAFNTLRPIEYASFLAT